LKKVAGTIAAIGVEIIRVRILVVVTIFAYFV